MPDDRSCVCRVFKVQISLRSEKSMLECIKWQNFWGNCFEDFSKKWGNLDADRCTVDGPFHR